MRGKKIIYPLAAGFFARLSMALFVNVLHPLFWEYGTIARNMLDGKGYSFDWYLGNLAKGTYPTAIMLPGQVFIHFLFFRLLGDTSAGYFAIFVLQCFMGVGFIYLAGKIAGAIFHSERIQLIALWIAAIYPPFVYATGTFGVASSVLVLNAFFVWKTIEFFYALERGPGRVKSGIWLGIAAGLLAYFRSEFSLLFLLTLLLVLWMKRDAVRSAIAPMAIAVLCYAAILAPWVIRNEVVFHRVIVSADSGPLNLWRGNSDAASGSSWNARGEGIEPSDSDWSKILPDRNMDASVEERFSKYLWSTSVDWIRSHPDRAALLSLKKTALIWGIDWYSPEASTWEYVTMYVTTGLLAVVGLLQLRMPRWKDRNRFGLRIIALWCIIYTLITMVFFALPRIQIFLIALYLPIVALGVGRVLEWILPSSNEGPRTGARPIKVLTPVAELHRHQSTSV